MLYNHDEARNPQIRLFIEGASLLFKGTLINLGWWFLLFIISDYGVRTSDPQTAQAGT